MKNANIHRALPGPVLAGGQEKAHYAPFLCKRIIREPFVNRLSRHILALKALRYSTVLLTTVPLPLCITSFLKFKDSLLTEINQQLPFSRHIVSSIQKFNPVENSVMIETVRTEEVVIGNPQ